MSGLRPMRTSCVASETVSSMLPRSLAGRTLGELSTKTEPASCIIESALQPGAAGTARGGRCAHLKLEVVVCRAKEHDSHRVLRKEG